MVRRASGVAYKAWPALRSSTEMGIRIRRFSSVILMGLLLTILSPFTPFSWVFPSEGAEMLDRFLALPLLFGALFFQWRIAGVTAPVAIKIANVTFSYNRAMYWVHWQFFFLELVICVVSNWVKNEIWRRFASVGVVGVLWTIGWAATPLRYKMQAWEHLKGVWAFMMVDDATRDVGGGRKRLRWRWYYL